MTEIKPTGNALDFRITYLRALACVLVVLLHVSGEVFGEFSGRWAAANIYATISRLSVPLFFMIAGATLLGKSESLGDFFSKRAIRIVPPMLFWSGVYILWTYYWTRSNDWPVKFLNGQAAFHLWYLYALIGIYAFVPILRRIYQPQGNAETSLYLAAWVITSAYTVFNAFLPNGLQDLLKSWHLWQFYGNTGYLLLGACLYHNKLIPKLTTRAWVALLLCGAILTAGLTHYYSKLTGAPSQLFFSNLSPNIILFSAAAFALVLRARKLPIFLDAPIQAIGNCSLGIYGIHILIVGQLSANWGVPPTIGNQWIGPLLSTMAALAISFGIVRILRFIPFMRRVA